MTAEARTYLRCDTRSRNCARSFEAVGTVGVVRALARELGWSYSRARDRDSCPGCELAK